MRVGLFLRASQPAQSVVGLELQDSLSHDFERPEYSLRKKCK